MIELFSYDKKKEQIVKGDIGKPIARLSWIRIIDPDPEQLKSFSKTTGIPVEELQESVEEEERPKVSQDEYLEIIYRAPYVVEKELETLPIYFYLFKEKLVTIEKKPSKILGDISKKMQENDNKFLFRKGFPYLIFYVMDKINDDFLFNIDKIASKIDIYERFSKKELTEKDIENIYDQSVTLSFFNQALIANMEVLNTLKKGYFKLIPKREQSYFEELYFDALQLIDTEKIQREAMANLINIHSILTSTRLNAFMKRLTSIALIVAIPTMLSGIYGMNFTYIPFADHRFGFYIVSFIMIAITFGSYKLFQRLNWL